MQEALSKNLESGSTANVVLAADGHILASNVGDSKSLLCSTSPNLPVSRGQRIPQHSFLHFLISFSHLCYRYFILGSFSSIFE